MAYTNASFIIDPEFRDTDELDGMFTGFDPQTGAYDARPATGATKARRRAAARRPRRQRQAGQDSPPANPAHARATASTAGPALAQRRRTAVPARRRRHGTSHATRPFKTQTASMKRHEATFPALHARDGRRNLRLRRRSRSRRSRKCWWRQVGRERNGGALLRGRLDQHTTGVQIIRAASILQLLLGNMGRPGGGIMALRGHCQRFRARPTSRLSTTRCRAISRSPPPKSITRRIDEFVKYESFSKGYWANSEEVRRHPC